LYCAPNPATAVLEIMVQARVREHAALASPFHAIVEFSPLEKVFKSHRRMTHDKAGLSSAATLVRGRAKAALAFAKKILPEPTARFLVMDPPGFG
jgi:hypothetical protein